MEIKILLCDDHRIFREGLKTLINGRKGMRVIGEAADGAEGVKKARQLEPDIVIMDISMPGLNGIEAARKIAGELRHTRIIALSMHSDRRFVTEALKAGAGAYLLKDSAFEELSSAIHSVASGKTYLDPAVASTVVKEYVGLSSGAHRSSFSTLSPREREVLQLIAEGVPTKQMASDLKVSVKTIETHRKKIMEKLGISSIAGLTKYAVREGLTSP